MRKLSLATLCALGLAAVATAASAAPRMSLFEGFGHGLYLDSFFSSSGFVVNDLSSAFSETDISGSQIVILSTQTDYTIDQLSALNGYVSGGGRLVLQSDGLVAQDGVNSVLNRLGSSIVNLAGGFDPGFHTTLDITHDSFTAGVTSLHYAFSSGLVGGTSIIRGVSGQTIAAYEGIGAGFVFALSDLDIQRYAGSAAFGGNGQLFLNFASASGVNGVPEPETWALLTIGFGGLGCALRRRRSGVAVEARSSDGPIPAALD